MKLTELSLKRPVTVCMFFVCMTVIGLLAGNRLPLESMPDIQFPGLWIQIPYPNSTPEDVERRIVRPAEEALATLSGLQRMNSESRDDGGGAVWIEAPNENIASRGGCKQLTCHVARHNE